MKQVVILGLLLSLMAQLASGQSPVREFSNFEAVNSGNSDFGYLPTGNTSVFTSNRKDFKHDHGYYKIYQYDAGRAKLQRLVKIPAKYNAGPACSIPGSTDMIVSLNKAANVSRGEKALMELWKVSAKGKLSRLKINGENYSCMHPTVSADGKYLYFSSNKADGLGGYDLYKVELKSNDKLGEMLNLGPEINSSGNDVFPVLHKEGQLSYASDKSGGMGGYDVYIAFLGKSGNYRYMMHPEVPINSVNDDFYLYMESDKAYLASNREGGKGDDDIYKMTLISPFSPFSTYINQVLLDSSGVVQQSKRIVVKDKLGEVVYETQSNDKGEYSLTLISEEPNEISVVDQVQKKVEPGKTFKSGMLVLPSERGIAKGQVTAMNRVNVPGAILQVLDGEGKVLSETVSDGDGKYQLSYPLTKGVNLKATLSGYKESSKNLSSGQKSQEVSFSLESTGSKTIDQFVVYFAPSSDRLDRRSKQSLDSLAKWVKSSPEEYQVVLNGHADCTGEEDLNLRLSLQRAQRCAEYLRRKGLRQGQLNTQGYGESRPVNTCVEGSQCSKEQLGKNRRVNAILINKK